MKILKTTIFFILLSSGFIARSQRDVTWRWVTTPSTTMNITFGCGFSRIPFFEGLAGVRDKNGKWGGVTLLKNG
ncbi:hypothetical protein [Flavobacterium marginilacus]|uniref:hypothetical protein n=1 Tax=Flavobacterium marginilacus TaxID=3003256 RepID=UPI00248EC001|nr:hypothetical protein [Flavobacterium marginilacus]